jgi:two-component system, OmpR family, KDP operon response regulator KdpE
MRVLLVDDEPQILRALGTALRARNYDVITAARGQGALDQASTSAPDLVVLDLGLPDMDGVEVLRRLRSWSDIPVIVLSVREGQEDKVAALDAGADDYVTKPFGVEELLARIRAARRRAGAADVTQPVLRFGPLEVDLGKRLVRRGDAPVHLTGTEYALLESMVTNPGKLLAHRWLLQKVWGPSYGDESHYLRVYIRQLRQKLGDDASSPVYIGTEPGVGYRWLWEPDTAPAQ